jgi:hypothetical protein
MTKYHRLDKVEARLMPEAPRPAIGMCSAPVGLSAREHAAWHHERDEYCFTLNLGATDIRGDDAA